MHACGPVRRAWHQYKWVKINPLIGEQLRLTDYGRHMNNLKAK